MWRTCRSPRSTAKFDHSDIILSESEWWRRLQECVQVMGEGIWCVQRCVTYSSNDTHMELSSLNHTDGHPVTWGAKVGLMTAISMSFHRPFARQEVGKQAVSSHFSTRN